MSTLQRIAIASLKAHPRNARTHSRKQVRQLADSIETFGFQTPILVADDNMILAGHGRIEAAKLLGLTDVPAIVVAGLSDAKKRALMLADNRIALSAAWDREILALEIPELSELLVAEGVNFSVAGFEEVEVDQIVSDFEQHASDPADDFELERPTQAAVSQPGDLWLLGKHRLLCGDARNLGDLRRLMDGAQADMVFADAPYNLCISNIVGRGAIKHAEFAMASGEMSNAEFVGFLQTTFANMAAIARDGCVLYLCTDWRHVDVFIQVGRKIFSGLLNVVVWAKTNIGQGNFYRSQHELIVVFRAGEEPHLNNVQQGRYGRTRSNVWTYPGVNTFRAGRMDDLAAHPTVKPVAMVADAMKDCTHRNDVVLDCFCGSGTTLMAAERVGRRGYGMEIEPRYVDIAIRRWQAFTGKDAIHVESKRIFAEIESGNKIASSRLIVDGEVA